MKIFLGNVGDDVTEGDKLLHPLIDLITCLYLMFQQFE